MAKASRIEDQRTQQPLCCACWLEHNDISCRCGEAVPSGSATPQPPQSRVRRDEEQLELF